MATNKHAQIRYHALDRCFNNFGRNFFITDLINACNETILMENLKTLAILAKLSINGYSEEHADEELYLHDVLRRTNDIYLYGMISAALGNAGGLFGVPTLIAHSIEPPDLREHALTQTSNF